MNAPLRVHAPTERDYRISGGAPRGIDYVELPSPPPKARPLLEDKALDIVREYLGAGTLGRRKLYRHE